MVSGRDNDRWTVFKRLACGMVTFSFVGLNPLPWKQPGHEVHGGDGHANAEEDAGEYAL